MTTTTFMLFQLILINGYKQNNLMSSLRTKILSSPLYTSSKSAVLCSVAINQNNFPKSQKYYEKANAISEEKLE